MLLRLSDVPPGFQHDQTFTALDALYVLNGHFPIYFPANFGRGPLFMYCVAGVLRMIGGHFVWSVRFTAVIWGMLGLATTLALARRYLSGAGALVAAALMATSFWYLLAARLGVESISLLPLTMAFLYLLNRGLERPSFRSLALAGLVGGIAMYTYLASRTLFALIPLLLLFEGIVWIHQRRSMRKQRQVQTRRLAGLLLALAVLLAVSGPLLIYLRVHPEIADRRAYELAGSVAAALRGDLKPLLGNTFDTVRSIVWSGSKALPYHYNVPGRAALEPVLAIFFLVGLTATTLRLRKRQEYLLLVALLLGVGPSLLTGADALYMRAIYAVPLLFILVARGLWISGTFVGQEARRLRPLGEGGRLDLAIARLSSLAGLLVAGLLIWHSTSSATAYFVRWADAEQTQRIYNADFRAAARLLAATPVETAAFIGSDRLMDLDRQTYELYSPKRSGVDWFALPDSPPLPASGDALYLIPASAQMPPALDFLSPYADDRFSLPGPGGKYELMQGLRLSANGVEKALAAAGVRPAASQVIFGDAVRLDGLGLREDGTQAELITRWTVHAPWPRSARPGYPFPQPKLAVALVDGAGYKWAQADATTAMPALEWRAGQALVEFTPLVLPADLPPGRYDVQLGMYDDEEGPLPVRTADGKAAMPTAVVGQVEMPPVNRGDPPMPPYEARQVQVGSELRALGSWESPEKLIAGIPTDLHVSWQAIQPLDTAGLRFRLKATADDGSVLWEQPADPAAPLPSHWPAGQVYRLTHRLQPETPVTAPVRTTIELCAGRGDAEATCAQVGRPLVLSRTSVFQLPVAPEQASGARWDDNLTLAGYDLAAAGQILKLTLYWRDDAPSSTPLKRFVHAVDSAGQIIAQSDLPLEDRGIPSAYWRPGEYVVDRVELEIPVGLHVRELRLGLYDEETGERLPAYSPTGDPLYERQFTIQAPVE